MTEIKPLKQIATEVRTQLKTEFPTLKFSVRTKYASMCQELLVKLVKVDFRVFKTEAEIREHFRTHGWGKYEERDMVNLTRDIERGYTQVNEYYIDESPIYTDEAKQVLKRVKQISQADNWDRSDIQTDYFDVHYWFFLTVGDWDRPLEISA